MTLQGRLRTDAHVRAQDDSRRQHGALGHDAARPDHAVGPDRGVRGDLGRRIDDRCRVEARRRNRFGRREGDDDAREGPSGVVAAQERDAAGSRPFEARRDQDRCRSRRIELVAIARVGQEADLLAGRLGQRCGPAYDRLAIAFKGRSAELCEFEKSALDHLGTNPTSRVF